MLLVPVFPVCFSKVKFSVRATDIHSACGAGSPVDGCSTSWPNTVQNMHTQKENSFVLTVRVSSHMKPA